MTDFCDDSDIFDIDPVDEQFALATEHVQRSHSSLPSQDLLLLYGLYKQATVGPCNTPKPSMFNMQARSKWSAWHNLGDLSPMEAKSQYIQKVQNLDPNWSRKDTKSKSSTNWVVHSCHAPPEGLEQEAMKGDHEKNAFDFCKEGDLEGLKKLNLAPETLSQLDEQGMGLVHWATDRNALDILDFLLSSAKVDVNLRDAEQQTALHYASSCAHLQCLRLLLQHKADCGAKDADGLTPLDVSENAEVQQILKEAAGGMD